MREWERKTSFSETMSFNLIIRLFRDGAIWFVLHSIFFACGPKWGSLSRAALCFMSLIFLSHVIAAAHIVKVHSYEMGKVASNVHFLLHFSPTFWY
jgi:hypothetical protein